MHENISGEKLLSMASEIVRKSGVKSFPDDYVTSHSGERISIPEGSTVMMFRQDESVVVSIDSQRIYLRTHDQAKFIFYSAKRGLPETINPYSVDLHEAIIKFEEDLDATQRDINAASKALSEHDSNELRSMCSRMLGYRDIF
ncbi:MAG: hypothetical protein M1267_04605 [Candidatus Thermoplasmatota archaeon]|jgi:hypothetical protein|nr:hypothetical protein [Candidatus Thermoplasmatota archaeon]MCL5800171.1 hypothetical protein [Candidatus Thermoplasmatota archaeon]